jgi:hypothetical protein
MEHCATRYGASDDALDLLCPCGAIKTATVTTELTLGRPVDPYFRQPLCLLADVRGKRLWAYNREHLAFLRRCLEGTLRRREPYHNASLASRLPAWLKSAKYRDAALHGIQVMARRQPSG